MSRRRGLALLVVAAILGGCGERREPAGHGGRRADEGAPGVPPRPPVTLDAARLDTLAAVEVPGWEVAARDRSDTSLVVALRALDGPRRALVTIAPCLACRPADPVAWQELLPELRAVMPGALEDDPATLFALDAVTLGERRCIATWELGAVAYGDEVEASHAARLYCNDTATQLVVRVDDDAVARAPTAEAARAAGHREPLEAAARRVATAFLAHL
jgi:hypothetical protein